MAAFWSWKFYWKIYGKICASKFIAEIVVPFLKWTFLLM